MVGARLTLFTTCSGPSQRKQPEKIYKLATMFYEAWKIACNFCKIWAAWRRAKLRNLAKFRVESKKLYLENRSVEFHYFCAYKHHDLKNKYTNYQVSHSFFTCDRMKNLKKHQKSTIFSTIDWQQVQKTSHQLTTSGMHCPIAGNTYANFCEILPGGFRDKNFYFQREISQECEVSHAVMLPKFCKNCILFYRSHRTLKPIFRFFQAVFAENEPQKLWRGLAWLRP